MIGAMSLLKVMLPAGRGENPAMNFDSAPGAMEASARTAIGKKMRRIMPGRDNVSSHRCRKAQILLRSLLVAIAPGRLALPPIRRLFQNFSRSEEHTSELQSRFG